ncbi:hypothetical protein [Amedibacterium intestinale]|uniref:Uncharacterized protein n=1 Tax=Amedibacterium intestinale TaxID=2583452 RepID=A0A6N4TIG6_9FIRM|nr:hypothetical protein [Amedibacterium intestinale]RHO22443.1 hypothetical protein DW220_04665 [Eubacterium sp. AM18-26]RHO24524.1 hypothetical protein DW212_09240 [Eubacterium sp. AM18-10LB-B]RHO32737.1 hypothetical protein DW208_02715 [Erysipelotrichaceae bacterium AM17-60]BBK22529.1 hypothetical protein Aargi30884_14320 [Amedibacterium intestinale]BBK62553.1 hypothetical protein A9CBEGH2_14930 [Amedibacterium intestinale]
METLIYIFVCIGLIYLFLAILPILLPLVIIILLVVGIFLLYIRHKIKRNMEDIQKDADTYFEDSRQIYDDSVIDVEYSESDVHDEE